MTIPLLLILVAIVIIYNTQLKKEPLVVEKDFLALESKLSRTNTDITILEDDVEQLQNKTLATEYEELRQSNFFTIMMEPDFFDFIYNNPVDKALKTFEPFEESTTGGIIEVLSDRCEVWDAEIQNSIIKLKEFLTEDDYQELLEGQKAWELYVERSFDIESALLHPRTEYIPLGSMYQPQVMATKSDKTRARAIELLGYIYIFTNEVSFVFIEN